MQKQLLGLALPIVRNHYLSQDLHQHTFNSMGSTSLLVASGKLSSESVLRAGVRGRALYILIDTDPG